MAKAILVKPSESANGQFPREMYAQVNANYGVAQLRNIYCGTGGMTNNSTNLANNVIYLQYE